ncbi:hypothetical protein F5880DRAFT_1599122 [Lentinula raphanica]|nr:hypothetical protein F5880DRAFT_1599122 [Lentinula raphanica]
MLFFPSNRRRHGLSIGFVFPAVLALVATMCTFAFALRPPVDKKGVPTIPANAPTVVGRMNFDPPEFSLPHFPVPEHADRISHDIHGESLVFVRTGYVTAIQTAFQNAVPVLAQRNIEFLTLAQTPMYPPVFEKALDPNSRYIYCEAGISSLNVELKGVLVAQHNHKAAVISVVFYYLLEAGGVKRPGVLAFPSEHAETFWAYVS